MTSKRKSPLMRSTSKHRYRNKWKSNRRGAITGSVVSEPQTKRHSKKPNTLPLLHFACHDLVPPVPNVSLQVYCWKMFMPTNSTRDFGKEYVLQIVSISL